MDKPVFARHRETAGWLLILVSLLLMAVMKAKGQTHGEVPAPTITERDQLVLIVLRQEVVIADLRLQKALADLAKPSYRIEFAAGQWRYVQIKEQ
jgi:hypothetical protein